MSSGFEVSVDGGKYICQLESNQDEKKIRINQEEYFVSFNNFNGSLLEIEINKQLCIFYCIENENETIIESDGFSFALRSNLLLSQVTLNRKNAGIEKVFQNLICADLFGKVLKLNIRVGDKVSSGQLLLTLESMKTEIHVLNPVNARVKKVHVREGDAVVEKELLVELEPIGDGD